MVDTRLSIAAVGLLTFGAAATILGQSATPYEMNWVVGGDPRVVSELSPNGHEVTIPLSGSPIQRERCIFVYQCCFGLMPTEGLHSIEADPQYMSRHLAQIAQDTHQYIPESFEGLVVIDYEPPWSSLWDRIPPGDSSHLRQRWRDAVLARNPHILDGKTPSEQNTVLASMYDELGRQFFLVTIQEGKRLRPRAKWGYFGYPMMVYHWPEMGASGDIIGYDNNDVGRRFNDRFQWLYDAEDIVIPAPYAYLSTVPEGGSANLSSYTDTIADATHYVASNVQEAIRVGRGKPVYSCMWLRYHDFLPTPFAHQFLNSRSLTVELAAPFEAGASGVLIWDSILSSSQLVDTGRYVASTLIPVANQVMTTVNAEQNARNHPGGSCPNVAQLTPPPPLQVPGGTEGASGRNGAAGGSGSTAGTKSDSSAAAAGGGSRGGGGVGGGSPGSMGKMSGAGSGTVSSGGVTTLKGGALKTGPTVSNAPDGRISAPMFTRAEVEAAIERVRQELLKPKP